MVSINRAPKERHHPVSKNAGLIGYFGHDNGHVKMFLVMTKAMLNYNINTIHYLAEKSKLCPNH